MFLKRALMESKEVSGKYNIQMPMRFLIPIINNNKESVKIDRYSQECYYEFSDIYDEKYYYSLEITPKYMKKWRVEDCPNIFKTTINKVSNNVDKQVIFKKIQRY